MYCVFLSGKIISHRLMFVTACLVIPLSDIGGLDIRTRNRLYPLLFVNVRYSKCSLNVLFMSCCHPLKSVTGGKRSISSPESYKHPPNIELNL